MPIQLIVYDRDEEFPARASQLLDVNKSRTEEDGS
ncbi:MAG: hypothetical protein ACUVSA_08385 [Desulfosoma sp.]